MNETYRIYFNWPTKKARIHRDTCGMCNQGQGVHTGKGDTNGEWWPHNRFEAISLEQAEALAELIAKSAGLEVSRCGHCLRH
jgi:hypothetical protein